MESLGLACDDRGIEPLFNLRVEVRNTNHSAIPPLLLFVVLADFLDQFGEEDQHFLICQSMKWACEAGHSCREGQIGVGESRTD